MEQKITNKKRETFIDVAKGIGIYFIVLVHLTVHGSVLSQYILSFCVPFFFVVSGMMFSCKREFKPFLFNSINKILIPLAVYGVIDAVFTIIKYFVIEGNQFELLVLIKIIAKISFVAGSANSNGPLWYLPVLFALQLIMYFPAKSGKKWMPAAVAAVMFVLGFFVVSKFLFRVGQIPVAFVLYCIGMYCKPFIFRLKDKKSTCTVIFVISLILFIALCYLNGFAEMAALNYGNNYLLYYFTALAATLAILCISIIINKNTVLEFFGKNSLTVMCTHYYIARYLVPLIFKLCDKENLLANQGIEILLSLVIMLIMVPVIIFINKKVPVLTGKVSLFKI